VMEVLEDLHRSLIMIDPGSFEELR
jgi:hypothetical protein